MSTILKSIQKLVSSGDVRISEHGYDELAEDKIPVRDLIIGLGNAVVIEDYPDFPKGPSVLVLQYDHDNRPVHVVWGIPKGHPTPAVLVTAYRPDPKKWDKSFRERKK